MIVDTYASTKFEAGPARAVMAMPCLGFLKYRISTGTGFAQPNKRLEPPLRRLPSSRTPGTRSVPTGSMCRIGLIVTRPSTQAVRSPQRLAI